MDAYASKAVDELNLSSSYETQKTVNLQAGYPRRWQRLGMGIAGLLIFGIISSYLYLFPISKTSSLLSENRQANNAVSKEITVEEPMESTVGFDLDGIYRVKDGKDSSFGAAYTLLRLWGTNETVREDTLEVDPLSLGSHYGFDTYNLPLDVGIIRTIGYPCIIGLQEEGKEGEHYAVLTETGEKNALVLDPIYGKTSYSIDELQEQWRARRLYGGRG